MTKGHFPSSFHTFVIPLPDGSTRNDERHYSLHIQQRRNVFTSLCRKGRKRREGRYAFPAQFFFSITREKRLLRSEKARDASDEIG